MSLGWDEGEEEGWDGGCYYCGLRDHYVRDCPHAPHNCEHSWFFDGRSFILGVLIGLLLTRTFG